MRKNSPEVIELRMRIEESIKRKVKTPADFDFLAGVVWERLHETISTSTLKRFWGYIDGADRTRESTLNQLSRCIGFESWDDFLLELKEEGEEESELCLYESIRSADLNIGEEIEVGWQPNRKCVFKYMGDDRFEVVSAENSKLQKGDMFTCSVFFKDEPMYADNVKRQSSRAVSYIAGSKSGLTLLRMKR